MKAISILLFSLPLLGQTVCSEVFRSTSNTKRAGHFEAFESAMSRGMLVQPHQKELLAAYLVRNLNIFTRSAHSDVRDLFSTLQKHPTFLKPPFREYEFSYENRGYKVPKEVAAFIQSQFVLAALVQSRVFHPEDNLDFWKDALSVPRNSDSDSFLAGVKYIISHAESAVCIDEYDRITTHPYFSKRRMAKVLFHIILWMTRDGLDTKTLRQTLIDHLYSSAYLDPKILSRLKSTDAEKVEIGLNDSLEYSSELSRSTLRHGFPTEVKTLDELRRYLSVRGPTGTSPGETYEQQIEKMKSALFSEGPFVSNIETYRLRSLSLQEAPFRGCIGKDCSTGTYFHKALEPGSYHFTITNQKNVSRGHITVVLGEAFNTSLKKMQKIAFIDKIQNFNEVEIPVVLNLAAKSLAERGYVLAIPKVLDDDHKLSGSRTVFTYFRQNILTGLTKKFEGFKPYDYSTGFTNGRYSRIYDNLDVYAIENLEMREDVRVRRGKITQTYYADPSLSSEIIPTELLNAINEN